MIETYQPYMERIAEYLRRKAPQAELLLHETWAYEIGSLHPGFRRYHQSRQEMYEKLSNAYRTAAKQTGVRIIPCGEKAMLT